MSTGRAAPPPALPSFDIGILNDRPGVAEVMAALDASGGHARYVGGCVRDAILDRPIRDIDIATVFKPDEVVTRLERAGLEAIPTGIEHGTVTAVAQGHGFEITTLRKDVETDGRRAVVAFTDDWVEDAARRDFTMNALSAEISGRIHDPFGGIADAHAGRVRFVGDPETRIREDVLRILRLFRFHAHYGAGDLDPNGLAAAGRLASLLPSLSAERVRAEVLRLLEAPDPTPTVEAMTDAGVLNHLPLDGGRLSALKRVVGYETSAEVEADSVRRLAVLANREAKAMAASLRLSVAEERRLAAITAPLSSDQTSADLKAAVYRHGAAIVRDRLLVTASLRGEGGGTLRQAVDITGTWTVPVFPLKGRDLIALGVGAGPALGGLLKAVESWWIEGDFSADHAQCLAEVRRRLEVSAQTADI